MQGGNDLRWGNRHQQMEYLLDHAEVAVHRLGAWSLLRMAGWARTSSALILCMLLPSTLAVVVARS